MQKNRLRPVKKCIGKNNIFFPDNPGGKQFVDLYSEGFMFRLYIMQEKIATVDTKFYFCII
jgi:hypothetical protein